jgi:hypothetical protein
MSSMKKIVCLANSKKLGERCIAGINLDTGRWVRPICDSLYTEDGRVPKSVRLIKGREPEILDIIEIPLSDTGSDFGFECENLSILEGEWNLIGKATTSDLINYCGDFSQILHNTWKYVNPSFLKTLSFEERRTLQLIKATGFNVSRKGENEWKGNIWTENSQNLTEATITDPVFIEKLEAGHNPKNNCLITVSLGIPWSPPKWDGEKPCWKLIAGIIEI